MAATALRNHEVYGNVNESPYSRLLKEMDETARKMSEARTEHSKGGDSDVDNANSSASAESDGSDDETEDEDSTENGSVRAAVISSPPQPDESVKNANAAAPGAADHVKVDLAQIQKKQAWLRGGGSGESEGSRNRRSHALEVSDTASIKSSLKKKARQPGLLEALFLPNTYKAAHTRSTPSRSGASVRPHVRRASTTELSKNSKAPSIADSASGATTAVSGGSQNRESRRSSTAPTLMKSAVSPAPKVECVSCLDEVPKQRSALLECKHRMCYTCLKRIFTLSTEDPQLMPPKCCTEEMIPLKHVDRLFSIPFKATWNRKYAEYTTKHRLYCPTKNCGEWIKPKYIEVDRATGRKIGKCKECKTKVCKKCGLKWHGGRDCENDESTKRVIDLGKEMGWQRCYNCRAMVQLSEGCNHMRCRCNAEFCMVCAQKWKTCDCPWFNLPPELGVEGFLDPGQAVPMPLLGLRIGDLPQLPPGSLPDWDDLPPPPPPPNFFTERRDVPLDPLNPDDVFRPPNLDRSRSRRRRTYHAEPTSSQEQEAIDEQLARQLQEQELVGSGLANDDAEERNRRRAVRRARRTVYAVTEGDDIHRLDNDEDVHYMRSTI